MMRWIQKLTVERVVIRTILPVFAAILATAIVFSLASAQPQQQDQPLRSCKNEVKTRFQAVKRSSINVYLADSSNPNNERNNTVNWQITEGRFQGTSGFCRVNQTGRVVSFQQNNNSDGTNNGNLQEFGRVVGIGTFSVIRDSYRYSTNGNTREFDALVNDRQQRWWADCRTREIGRQYQQAIRQNQGTLDVNLFVCTDQYANGNEYPQPAPYPQPDPYPQPSYYPDPYPVPGAW
jgi:type II secretory pathway pseudopilin PulG